jgi:hypothetical protein
VQNIIPKQEQSKYQVRLLDWRDQNEEIPEFDLVLVSDCIYEGLYGQVWKDLAKVLNRILRPNQINRALNCVERRKEDGIDRFIEYCVKEYSMQSKLLVREELDHGRIIELYEITKS